MSINRFKYVSVVGLTAAALLAGPVAGATATPQSATTTAVRPTLTAKATANRVRVWQQFRIYGASRHLKTGTRVTLQQKQGKRWVALPVSMRTNNKAAYNLRVKLGLKGRNSLRMVGGGAISPTVFVTVR
ncbi:hypothetical protein [Streptomyces sp. A5-4]|uniref:hypothetical protein n=1 Tax=Streptomyces sp. A5-4 TaxID=3384771 RepID=UPI003DA9C25C